MKSILVFSNGEKIGDGIIKLPLLNELKRRLPNYKVYWMTDQGTTVYSSILKDIVSSYIDHTFENVNLNSFFSRIIFSIFVSPMISFGPIKKRKKHFFDLLESISRFENTEN